MNIALFTWLLFPVAEAVVQGLLFKYKPNYGHTPGDAFYLILFFLRGIAAILHGAFVVDAQPGCIVPLFGFYVSSHWLLFDPLLNKIRKKPFDYEGKNSGWLKFIPYKWQAVISLVLIVVCSYWMFKLGYV